MLEKWLARPILITLLKLFFGVHVRGMEHVRAAGDKCIIICNHQSFLDPLLLAVFLPDKPAFAMNLFQAERWYFRWLGKLVKIYTLDPSKPMSMKSLMKDLQAGGHVVIFPEGRITTTGGIMKIYDGVSLIAGKTGASILPVHIDGAEYSFLSNLKGKVRRRFFPKISLTVFPARRQPMTSQAIYDLMTETAFLAANYRRPVLAAALDAARRHGASHALVEDIARAPMSYRQLFTRAFVLKDKLNSLSPLGEGKFVGVLLPNALGTMVTFVSLHMLGKVPCMLNFSAGAHNIVHACRIADVKTVLTSRVFVERGKLEPVIEALQAGHTIIYLEDIRPQVTIADKLKAALLAFFPRLSLGGVLWRTAPDDPAVVLYTSGSEGAPKGVALSHANLLANIYQVRARVDLTPADIIFNAMPVFHSFGLTVGLVLPLVSGVRAFLYPTPLHYRVIPDMVYDTNATVMIGTDTFLRGYANYAHPYDFGRVRFVVAGAEKLKDSTRVLWMEKYGVRILEGYGVTEASPVVSVNTPMEHKAGTVGRVLPTIECRLQPVAGLEKGGRLEVRGPNVMLGYLKADQPGVIQPQKEWYDTGDIVSIDAGGFIAIQGRAKRFAKIGGEMVSLQAVEDLAFTVESEAAHAAVAMPDDRKGEQIVLYTESKMLTREQLMARIKELGGQELSLPKQVVFIEVLPRLGNGKIDYMTLAKSLKSAA